MGSKCSNRQAYEGHFSFKPPHVSKKRISKSVVVANIFSPSSWDAEAGGFLWFLKPAWCAQWVPEGDPASKPTNQITTTVLEFFIQRRTWRTVRERSWAIQAGQYQHYPMVQYTELLKQRHSGLSHKDSTMELGRSWVRWLWEGMPEESSHLRLPNKIQRAS